VPVLACGLAWAEAPAPQGGNQTGPRVPLNVDKADKLLNDANFVFVGTVMKTNASNLSLVQGSPKTALVRVETVLHGTPLLRSTPGQMVTVRAEQANRYHLGQRSTFFLHVDTFGENLSGLQLGAFPFSPGEEISHGRMVESALKAQDDRDLKHRMLTAEQVVSGRIVSIHPAGIKEDLTEHAAHWQQADIEVATVIKGQPSTRTVSFFFPASSDRVWREVPRFALGEEGVWILSAKPKDGSRKAEMIPGLTALHPKDFQRVDQRERLQRLNASN
jgi:hypothetical protein